MSQTRLMIDGRPPATEDLAYLALVNYGAYTSFGVQDGAVRGLDLHLARLEQSAVELFGEPVGEMRLRALIVQALDGRRDAWLRVSLFANAIGHRDPDWIGSPRVMVAVSDPPTPLAASLKVRPWVYFREEPHLKHTATFGLMRARRAVRAEGFDDALFVDREGRISEGSLWNVGFLRGDTVVWPQAPALAGVAQALVQAGLSGVGMTGETRSVRLSDLDGFDGVFACNSATTACAVTAIGERTFAADPARMARLIEAWRSNPPQSPAAAV